VEWDPKMSNIPQILKGEPMLFLYEEELTMSQECQKIGTPIVGNTKISFRP
jgi:hypothetical protein